MKEPRFTRVCSIDNLKKGREHHKAGTHWRALFLNKNLATYFDRFCTEHIPLEIKKVIGSS